MKLDRQLGNGIPSTTYLSVGRPYAVPRFWRQGTVP